MNTNHILCSLVICLTLCGLASSVRAELITGPDGAVYRTSPADPVQKAPAPAQNVHNPDFSGIGQISSGSIAGRAKRFNQSSYWAHGTGNAVGR